MGKQGLLDRQVFHHGFHHQIAVLQVVEVFGTRQAAVVIGHLLGGETAFFLEFLPLLTNLAAGFFCGTSHHVEHHHLRLGLRGHLGNALTHGSRAYNTNFLEA